MKKWILISSLSIVVLAAGSGTGYYFWDKHTKQVIAQRNSDYRSKLLDTAQLMLKGGELATMMCANYSDVWNKAIDSNYGIQVDGHWATDFNDAIRYKRASFDSDGSIKTLEDTKKHVDDNLRDLNLPPEEFKESYEVLMKMHDAFAELISQGESPSGSLVRFNQSVDEMTDQLTKSSNELTIRLPK